MICKRCGREFPSRIIVDGIQRNLSKRRYCLECVPFNSSKRAIVAKDNIYGVCANCGKPLSVKNRKYCSMKCGKDYLYKEYIKKWKSGEIDGVRGKGFIDVSGHIKRYLFEKYNNKCAKCGWSEINPYTQTLPLEIEHIDGNAMNNKEENLTLLCPNCHSLTETYRGANRGKGARNIKWISRSGSTNVNK